jgi:hypothetical protein
MKMKHSERFALGQWLCAYPDDASYDAVLQMVRDEDERVTVWEPLDRSPSYEVADVIEDTKIAVERMLDDLVYGVRLSDKTEEESI